MARFNELLVGRYNRMMQKLFSMKGPASLRTLSDEMFVNVPIFNGAENRYLETWNRFGSNLNQPSGANNPVCQIRNPVGSNTIVVVEKIIVALSLADPVPAISSLFMRVTADQATVPGVAVNLDLRNFPSSAVIRSRGNSVGFPAGVLTIGTFGATLANQPYDWILDPLHEIPVLPGDGLGFIGIGAAALSCTFVWRERFLEDSERA